MISIIGAILFAIVTVLTILVACGAPLGEFTMGGKHKVLPKEYRIMAVISILIQVFAILIILQAGGYLTMWFSAKATKIICIVFAAYLSLNTLMNAFSKSKKERFFATPLSILEAICYWITAFKM